ncbi:uncharacterized protein [Cicer arietinum]|uniref:Uncharacterized protein LOC101500821 n=1 Tax=Cicer arietinum TaxID=3827 RepID=A0A1S2Z0G8_CICAR|nr:uncharacterized protein LOC101500821 [Cicer arietinum]
MGRRRERGFNHRSLWWRDILVILEGGLGEEDGCFGIDLSREVGMVRNGVRVGRDGWTWRELFQLLGQCIALLDNFSLQENILDQWSWHSVHNIEYTVKGAYRVFSLRFNINRYSYVHICWNKMVMLKVLLFVRRLLEDRLPSKSNLGCKSEESSYHLFLECLLFGKVWQHIFQWLEIPMACPMQDTTTRFDVF